MGIAIEFTVISMSNWNLTMYVSMCASMDVSDMRAGAARGRCVRVRVFVAVCLPCAIMRDVSCCEKLLSARRSLICPGSYRNSRGNAPPCISLHAAVYPPHIAWPAFCSLAAARYS